jgi:hypothetical protein
MAKNILEQIRKQVREQSYDISNHALAEAVDDGFDPALAGSKQPCLQARFGSSDFFTESPSLFRKRNLPTCRETLRCSILTPDGSLRGKVSVKMSDEPKILKKYSDDPRGTRYEIIGVATDHRRHVTVIGRFRGDQVFRIITVYETKP